MATYIVFSNADSVSAGMAMALMRIGAFKGAEALNALPSAAHFASRSTGTGTHMLALNTRLMEAEYLDSINADVLIFLSGHSSMKGVPSFTVHAVGNWSNEAALGGKPNELGVAAPMYMRAVLCALHQANNDKEMAVTYEATHHGPLLNTPSLFVEIERNSYSKERAEIAAHAVMSALDSAIEMHMPIAIGIGGTHYPQKFTSLALSGRYAFGHIMPKHHISNVQMLKKAAERSEPKASIAVIEWKSINSIQRTMVTEELNKLGIPYDKV